MHRVILWTSEWLVEYLLAFTVSSHICSVNSLLGVIVWTGVTVWMLIIHNRQRLLVQTE